MKSIVYDVAYITTRDLYAYASSDHSISIVKEKEGYGDLRMIYTLHNRIFHQLLHTRWVHTPKQYTRSIHPVNTPYQHSRSTLPINPCYQPTLLPSSTPTYLSCTPGCVGRKRGRCCAPSNPSHPSSSPPPPTHPLRPPMVHPNIHPYHSYHSYTLGCVGQKQGRFCAPSNPSHPSPPPPSTSYGSP